jgi:hypothetical protein
MGKMISLQSLAVAVAATGMARSQEVNCSASRSSTAFFSRVCSAPCGSLCVSVIDAGVIFSRVPFNLAERSLTTDDVAIARNTGLADASSEALNDEDPAALQATLSDLKKFCETLRVAILARFDQFLGWCCTSGQKHEARN